MSRARRAESVRRVVGGGCEVLCARGGGGQAEGGAGGRAAARDAAPALEATAPSARDAAHTHTNTDTLLSLEINLSG